MWPIFIKRIAASIYIFQAELKSSMDYKAKCRAKKMPLFSNGPNLKKINDLEMHYGVITRGLPSKNIFCVGYSFKKQALAFKVTKNDFLASFKVSPNSQFFETINSYY